MRSAVTGSSVDATLGRTGRSQFITRSRAGSHLRVTLGLQAPAGHLARLLIKGKINRPWSGGTSPGAWLWLAGPQLGEVASATWDGGQRGGNPPRMEARGRKHRAIWEAVDSPLPHWPPG